MFEKLLTELKETLSLLVIIKDITQKPPSGRHPYSEVCGKGCGATKPSPGVHPSIPPQVCQVLTPTVWSFHGGSVT
jgi:hypothetical protein